MNAIFLFAFPLLMFSTTLVLYDFEKEDTLEGWYVVNDGVMGGLSKGTLTTNKKGNAVFTGSVSLDNNGGFTSIRYNFEPAEVSAFTTVKLRIKGDGKRYQFRVKSFSDERHSYINYFQTSGEWEVIELSLKDLYPSFRGQRLQMPNYPIEAMSEISILIANNKEERFQLLMDKIWLE